MTSTVSTEFGYSGLTSKLVDKHPDQRYGASHMVMWNYALRELIKSTDKKEIARHIAPYAESSVHRENPELLLGDKDAYRSARFHYIMWEVHNKNL